MRTLAVLAVALLLGGCAGEAGPDPGTAGPEAGKGPYPEDLDFVWTVKGSTDEPGLYNATYFNDPLAERLRPGPVYVAWSCSGTGQLAVQPSIVGRPGPVVPVGTPTVLAFHLSCPTEPGTLRWIQLAAPALGGEDVVVIRPAIEPSGTMEYEIGFAQAPT